MGRFKVTPRVIAWPKKPEGVKHLPSGYKPPEFYSAQVKNSSGMLHPLNKSKNKPFWVRFKSGHQALVVRSLTKKMRGSDKPALKKLLGPSNAQIYGNDKMHELANNEAYVPTLKQAIEDAIKKTLVSAKTKQ